MKNRKALALIAILALVAAACGGSDGGSDDAVVEVETTEALQQLKPLQLQLLLRLLVIH